MQNARATRSFLLSEQNGAWFVEQSLYADAAVIVPRGRPLVGCADLPGTVLHYVDTGSLVFGRLGLGSPGTLLIFIAFGIKCAFPLLHNWLQDAYPEATVTGTGFLSVFTTMLAVYTLARAFAGESILIGIGVTMTLFPIFFAVIAAMIGIPMVSFHLAGDLPIGHASGPDIQLAELDGAPLFAVDEAL